MTCSGLTNSVESLLQCSSRLLTLKSSKCITTTNSLLFMIEICFTLCKERCVHLIKTCLFQNTIGLPSIVNELKVYFFNLTLLYNYYFNVSLPDKECNSSSSCDFLKTHFPSNNDNNETQTQVNDVSFQFSPLALSRFQ